MIGYFVGVVVMIGFVEYDRYRTRKYYEEQDRRWRLEVKKLMQSKTISS
jgi:hypothetical protein